MFALSVNWLINNIGSILVALALALVVALIIMKLVSDKKNGTHNCSGCSGCSGNCGGCTGCAEHKDPKA